MRFRADLCRSGAILAFLWGAGWWIAGGVVGAVTGWGATPHTPIDLRLRESISTALAAASTYGRIALVVGALFAGALVVTQRRRTLESLQMRTVAAIGAIAGAVPPLVTLAIADGNHRIPLLSIMQPIVVGALTGVATIALARWANRHSSVAPPVCATPTCASATEP